MQAVRMDLRRLTLDGPGHRHEGDMAGRQIRLLAQAIQYFSSIPIGSDQSRKSRS
jgi:hypothetical protein